MNRQPVLLQSPTSGSGTNKQWALPLSFIANYVQDNYLQGARFYIVTALFVLFQTVALFAYAIVLNWDASALDLEPEAAANLVLLAATLVVFALALWGVSREVRVEYAFFACAAWFIYNTVTSGSCLCCVGSTSTTAHDHGRGGASSVLDAANHRLVDAQDACTNEQLVYGLHNGFFILLIVIHYVVLLFFDCNYHYWLSVVLDVIKQRKQRAQTRAQASLVNTDVVVDETVTEDATTHPPWFRILLVVLLLGLAAVPLACNSVQRLTFAMLLGKSAIVLALVTCRLTNTYLTRYTFVKTATTHLTLLSHPLATHRFDQTLLTSADARQLIGEPVADTLKQTFYGRWTVQCLTDVALGATAWVLCDWYMFACLAQLLVEVYLLAYMHLRLGAHMTTLARILGFGVNTTTNKGDAAIQM